MAVPMRCVDGKRKGEIWKLHLGSEQVVLRDAAGHPVAEFTPEEAAEQFRMPSFSESIKYFGIPLDDGMQQFEVRKEGLGEIRDLINATIAAAGAEAVEAMKRQAIRDILIGLACTIGGLTVTIGTYMVAANAPQGGRYYITSGVLVFGVGMLAKGIYAYVQHGRVRALSEFYGGDALRAISQDRGKASLDPEGDAELFVPPTSPIVALLAWCSLVLSWAPLLGLVLGMIGTGLTWARPGRLRAISRIGLGIAVLIHIGIVALFIQESAGRGEKKPLQAIRPDNAAATVEPAREPAPAPQPTAPVEPPAVAADGDASQPQAGDPRAGDAMPAEAAEAAEAATVEPSPPPDENPALAARPPQPPADGDARWRVVFSGTDPAAWDREADGATYAIPLGGVPEGIKHLRLKRLDTGESLILPITRSQLATKVTSDEDSAHKARWSGDNQMIYGGRHLGIAEGPLQTSGQGRGSVAIQMDGRTNFFAGSGFGHQAYGGDKTQHFGWRGRLIEPTAFEIAVTAEDLTPAERDQLVE